jgi:hypothetical protein
VTREKHDERLKKDGMSLNRRAERPKKETSDNTPPKKTDPTTPERVPSP